jgi:hypothetical protein
MCGAPGDGPVTIYRHRRSYLVSGPEMAPVMMVTVLTPTDLEPCFYLRETSQIGVRPAAELVTFRAMSTRYPGVTFESA